MLNQATGFFKKKQALKEMKIENLTFHFGLHQVIKEPTHISDTFSSCINLIFTSHTSLMIDTRVHSSPLLNFHYQIISVKYNLKTIYPPLYVWGVWHHKDANIELIRRTINKDNSQSISLNTNVNEKVKQWKLLKKNIIIK